MYISNRERKMMEFLLEKESSITVKELSERLGVSVRTVHRDLKNMEYTLKSHGLRLIKKTGKGLSIKGTDEAKHQLRNTMIKVAPFDYTPEERQALILSTLFTTKDPVKLFTLANDLQVTIATISHDLDNLKKQLNEFKLQLIRRRGLGVYIEGDEHNKRQAIRHLITNYMDPFELITMYKENTKSQIFEDDNVAERLLGLVQKEQLKQIEYAVEQIKDDMPYELADNAYIGLIVHLALAMERLRNGDTIQFDPSYLQQIEDKDEYRIACNLIHHLEKALDVKIPEDEIGYITMHLLGAKLSIDHHYVIEDSAMDVAYKAKELIQYVSLALDVQLHHSTTLLNDLVAHLKPAMYRMKKDLKITNPIIDDIERDYKELYQLLEEAVENVFPEWNFPRDEIGYLVLHFGSVLFYNPMVKHVKTLVICASGIGTAKILETQLQREFPEITEVENISMFELGEVDAKEYDLILSTVQMEETTFPYIMVSTILTEKEKEGIKQKLRKQLVTYQHVDKNDKEHQIDYFHQLNMIHKYGYVIVELLKTVKVMNCQEIGTMNELLQTVCSDLKTKGYVRNEHIIFEKLQQREKMGGMGLPNSTVALYHTRSDEVSKPSFTIYRLTYPVKVKGMQTDNQKMDTMVMMLAPENVDQKVLEILSFISSLFVQHINAIPLFVKGTEKEIQQFLSQQLFSFLKGKNLM